MSDRDKNGVQGSYIGGKEKPCFQEVVVKEEISWHKKCRINWLKQGDNNTRFCQSHRKISKDLNSTFITLIPKKCGPRGIKECYPTGFVASLYKILVKVLSNRLKEVLPEVIDGIQFTFIKYGNILDSILDCQ